MCSEYNLRVDNMFLCASVLLVRSRKPSSERKNSYQKWEKKELLRQIL